MFPRDFLFLLPFLLATPQLLAASYDCSKSQTKVEHLICDTPSLSAADSEMAKLYRQAKIIDASAIQEQRDWIKYTRNKCSYEGCLEAVYKYRIQSLSKLSSHESITERKTPVQENTIRNEIKNNAPSASGAEEETTYKDWKLSKERSFDGTNYLACSNSKNTDTVCMQCASTQGRNTLKFAAFGDNFLDITGGAALVTVRIDNNENVEVDGTIAGGKGAIVDVIGYFENKSDRYFSEHNVIGQMKNGNQIAVRILSNVGTSDIFASLRGFTAASQELLSACGYDEARRLSIKNR